MKKIYTQEWLSLHAYKQSDSVDFYYIGLANRIVKELQCSNLFETEYDVHRAALCLTAYLEDVVSRLGIWQAFTAECKERYGSYLPFYQLGEDYYTDEVNKEDVCFLMWHHMQCICRGEKVINPENKDIVEAASAIYELLFSAYEEAPENRRMYDFLYGTTYGNDDFDRYREVLEWFHFLCYINIENNWELMDETSVMFNENKISTEHINLVQYGVKVDLQLNGRCGMLSLTSPEWLARIGANHPETALWADVKVQSNGFYLYEKEDKKWIYVKALTEEGEPQLKLNKASFDQHVISNRQPGQSVLACSLVYFGESWWQSGMLVENVWDEELKRIVEKLKEEKENVNEKAVYEKFMKASGGKRVVFFQTGEDVRNFFIRMGYQVKEEDDLSFADAKHGIMLMAAPDTGIQIQYKLVECISSPDNPFYDRKKAERAAYMYILNPDVIPYTLCCILQDENMLPDAAITSRKGKEYGKEFLHKHAQFFTDYFYRRYREKDYALN